MFDNLASAQLPGRLPVFCVAFGITGGQGQYELGLQVESPSGKAVNMKMPQMQLQDPRASGCAPCCAWPGMPFEEFGTYTFRMVVDGVPLAEPECTCSTTCEAQQNSGVPGRPPRCRRVSRRRRISR